MGKSRKSGSDTKKSPDSSRVGVISCKIKSQLSKSTVVFDMYYIEKAVDVFVYQYCL
jgi:hypothetical protein